jgi:glutamate synthase (NADPH/NADH) large chain
LQCYFRADGKPGSLKAGLDRLCRYAVDAVEDGFEVLILQDRAIDSDHAPIPSLMATSAVHHHLIRKGYRGKVGIVVERVMYGKSIILPASLDLVPQLSIHTWHFRLYVI